MRPAAPLTEVSSAPSRTRFEFPMGRNELAFGALPDFLSRHEDLPFPYITSEGSDEEGNKAYRQGASRASRAVTIKVRLL